MSLSSLETLDLSNNEISSIPKEIENLKKLKVLCLGFNNLHSVPVFFEKLEIEYLDLSENNIKKFDLNIPSLINLTLDFNPLRDMPKLSNYLNLKFLSLAHCQIRVLPNAEELPPALKYLNLAGNKIDSLHPNLSKGIKYVMYDNPVPAPNREWAKSYYPTMMF